MIFVSGIHGVGKTYFCEMTRERLGIKSFSASELIAERKKQGFSPNKLVSDIDENQGFLLDAIECLRRDAREFIIDGHFCLLDVQGQITRIQPDTYAMLNPDLMVLLTEEPAIIVERRLKRDGVKQESSEIQAFQDEERQYAEEISDWLNVPLIVSKGANDFERVIKLIEKKGSD